MKQSFRRFWRKHPLNNRDGRTRVVLMPRRARRFIARALWRVIH